MATFQNALVCFALGLGIWGLVGFAIGSETNGSIMNPSAYCGVSGLRPTFGRVSRYGAMALMWTSDKLGPMARSARDAGVKSLLLSHLAPDVEGQKDAVRKSIRTTYAGPVDFANDKMRIAVAK